MNRKDIEFDAEELAGSVEAFAAHVEGKKKLTLRSNQMSMEQMKPALEPKTPGTATVEKHRPLLDKPASHSAAGCAREPRHYHATRNPLRLNALLKILLRLLAPLEQRRGPAWG